VSTVLPVVEHLAPYLRDLGHEPVAVVSARPTAARPERAAFVTALVTGAPPYLDVLYAKDGDAIAPLLRAYEPDLLMCWGYPWKLPLEALEVPRLGCINLHPGKLPRHRGPIPLSWALRDGDAEFGITWHRMDPELDTGGILAQTTVPILDEETTLEEVGPRLGIAALGLLPLVLERVAAGDPGEPQDEAAATWAGRFGEDYATVDLGRTAREVHNQVRAWAMAFGPGPIAQLDSGRVRLTKTSLVEAPGATRVECGDAPIWVVAYELVDT
jgi:methionyl-tRNA formyltransferase